MTKRLVPLVLALLLLVAASTHGFFILAARKSARAVGPILPSRTEIVFRVDASFAASERVLILEALQRIKQVSGCVDLKVFFEHVGTDEILSWRRDGHATIYKASNPFTWKYHMVRYFTGPGSYMGVAMVRTGDIFIIASEDGEGSDAFRNTITHEVLHVVFKSGWHSQDRNSLMYHSIGGSKQLLLESEAAKLRAMCAGDVKQVSNALILKTIFMMLFRPLPGGREL